MLTGFVSFLDDHLADRGVRGLLDSALGILAFGGVLGAAIGSTGVKTAGLTITALYVIGILVILARRHVTLRRQVQEHEALLARYPDLIHEKYGPLWRIDRWEEELDIAQNGDTIGSITVHAVAQEEELWFVRLRIGPRWDQPIRMRRKVRVRVGSVETDGVGGTRYRHTSTWLPDGRLDVVVHFTHPPLRRGDGVGLRLDVDWPGKAAPLMRFGEPDEFTMRMVNPLVYAGYRVVLPAGLRARYDPIGLHGGVDRFTLTTSTAGGGRPVVHLQAHDIPADRRFGMRLDLK